MRHIRIGNTVTIKWTLTDATGAAMDLDADTLELYYSVPNHRVRVTAGFTVSDNVITWTFAGADQKYTGEYILTMVQGRDTESMVTADLCGAFALVKCGCLTGGSDADEVETDAVEASSQVATYQVKLTDEAKEYMAAAEAAAKAAAASAAEVEDAKVDLEEVLYFNGIVEVSDTDLEATENSSTDDGCCVVYNYWRATFLLQDSSEDADNPVYYHDWADADKWGTDWTDANSLKYGRIPHEGKIYINTETKIGYSYFSGTVGLTEVSNYLALGHTSLTAYPGSEGLALQEAFEALGLSVVDGQICVTYEEDDEEDE